MKHIGRGLMIMIGVGLMSGCIVIPVENHREQVHYHHHASPRGTEPPAERVGVEESDLQIQWGEGDLSEIISEITEDN